MTRDELVEMAAEAIYRAHKDLIGMGSCRRFARAAIVGIEPAIRADEREQCAKIADDYDTGSGEIADAIRNQR